MSRPVQSPVHHPVLTGRQSVAALWLPMAWFDEAARRRLIVGSWRPGATVTRFAEGDVLQFSAAIELDCARIGAWPLRRQGTGLASAPLDARELAALPPADVWVVVGSSVLALRWADGERIDPAAWIDAQRAALHDVAPWQPPETELHVLITDPRSVREVVGDKVGPPSAEQLAFLERLRQRKPGRQRTSPPASSPTPPQRSHGDSNNLTVAVAVMFLGIFGAILKGESERGDASHPFAGLAWLAGIGAIALLWWKFKRAWGRAAPNFPVARAAERTAASSSAARPGPASVPMRRAPLVPERWREWAARVANLSQLSRLLGRQQARYLQRMLDMFESGDLDQALRHAVPLGGEAGESLGQALGTPSARQDLSLRGPGTPIGVTSLHVGDDFQEHLRKLYRKTFEQLDRQNRIDEALFVLAELLNARQEALDYLEKHGRFAQAAELALAWDMPAAVIVRMHALAGDWRRAVAVAHRDAAFADAVVQLEKKWPDAAHQLREAWGRTLAAQGQWLAAVDAVWPVERLRPLAAEWVQVAEQAGGLLSARALVRRAALLPDTLTHCEARLMALRDDPERHAERAEVAEALRTTAEGGDGVRLLAAVVAPAVLADVARHRRGLDKKTFQALLDRAGDRFLQADLPGGTWPAAASRPLLDDGTVLHADAPDPGGHAVLDAMPLDDGRTLVALGEAGAAVIGADGRWLHRFATPAQRLVAAASGQQALALAMRESLWRVSRIDVAQRRAIDLGMLKASHVASTFDGMAWTIANGTRVQVLDTTEGVDDVLWQVADLPGPVTGLASDGAHEQVLVHDESTATGELWTYALPARRLSRRDAVAPRATEAHRELNAVHGVVDFTVTSVPAEPLALMWRGRTVQGQFTGEQVPQGPLTIWLGGAWLLLRVPSRGRHLLHCLRVNGGAEGARIDWPSDGALSARWHGNTCTLFDARGRVMHLDADRSDVRRLSLV